MFFVRVRQNSSSVHYSILIHSSKLETGFKKIGWWHKSCIHCCILYACTCLIVRRLYVFVIECFYVVLFSFWIKSFFVWLWHCIALKDYNNTMHIFASTNAIKSKLYSYVVNENYGKNRLYRYPILGLNKLKISLNLIIMPGWKYLPSCVA